MTVAEARENVGSPVVQQTGIQCFNCKEFGQFTKECRKPKRVKDSTYHKEKMLLCKQADKTLEESNKIQGSCLVALKTKQTEFEKYKAYNDRTIDYDKLKRLAKEKIKTRNDSLAFVHELKQEMHADLKYVESLEKEIDELEFDKAEFSNMYDTILQECVSNDVMCTYLHSLSYLDAHTELQCLYLHKVKECECLALKLSKQTESVSKEVYTEVLLCFAKLEKHSISFQLALQECQELMKNDTICKEKASNVFQKECEEYFKIQDLKTQLQDKNIAISELKKLIEKCKGNSVETKFDKPYVVRQPNTQRIPKPSVLGKPDLEVAFQKSTCFVRDLQGNDLLIGNRGSDLYIISLQESNTSTPICLMAKASPTQSWLWHRILSHLNFNYINLLLKKDVVIGLPKMKYVKDQW
nr:integrase, catalytic region, zinc finger, CCHC-type, peptidase aspartic, catalytic [Tanacetum cinerariifolium]